MSASPDAAIFAALLAQGGRGGSARAEPGDGIAVVLRLTEAVREVTAQLRDASAQLSAPRDHWTPADLARLARTLDRAEQATLVQAECTAALLRSVALAAPESLAGD